MVTNSTSQTKKESAGQTGCEACIKKDEIITDLYEALKKITTQFGLVDKLYVKDHEIISRAEQALAKVDEQKPEVKQRKAKQMRKYIRDPKLRDRFLARWLAKRMTENGMIEQQPCALCGNPNSQRHHPDYNEPLLIVWLCADCHRELHKKAKAGS